MILKSVLNYGSASPIAGLIISRSRLTTVEDAWYGNTKNS